MKFCLSSWLFFTMNKSTGTDMVEFQKGQKIVTIKHTLHVKVNEIWHGERGADKLSNDFQRRLDHPSPHPPSLYGKEQREPSTKHLLLSYRFGATAVHSKGQRDCRNSHAHLVMLQGSLTDIIS